MGFWDSLGRSVKKITGTDTSAMEDALKAQQKASAAQQAKADAERKKIKDKEDSEKARLEGKKMRGLKRKFGGGGLMGASGETSSTLGG